MSLNICKDKLVKSQAVCRRWLSNKNNLLLKFKTLQPRFTEVITGYHMINDTPIKESVWEEINCSIVNKICAVSEKANGNHISGKDNKFGHLNISNKSTKINGTRISLSSYRLTNICSDKNHGCDNEIINEIQKRDQSFDYYSILLRNELEKHILDYSWYMVPKSHFIFKITHLSPTIGKIGKKKGTVIGWESQFCKITFSMSSQLWYHFDIKHIESYKICQVQIDNNSIPKLDYSDIYNNFIR